MVKCTLYAFFQGLLEQPQMLLGTGHCVILALWCGVVQDRRSRDRAKLSLQ
jgi:hypothetical protein